MNEIRLVSRDHRVKPDDGGVVAVEFALVLPLLIMLIFTMVIGGSVYVDQLHLQSVARNAARVGAVDSSRACTTALSELATNAVGDVQCELKKSCSPTVGTTEVELIAVQDVSIPLIGEKVVTLHASSSFVCAP